MKADIDRYITIPTTSTIVVIAGVATTAGSILQHLTNIGNIVPINMEHNTWTHKAILIVIAGKYKLFVNGLLLM